MSTTKLSLCTAFNPVNVLFDVQSKLSKLVCNKIFVTKVSRAVKDQMIRLCSNFSKAIKPAVVHQDFVLALFLLLFWEWNCLIICQMGESARAWLGGESQTGDMVSRWGESNPQDAMLKGIHFDETCSSTTVLRYFPMVHESISSFDHTPPPPPKRTY